MFLNISPFPHQISHISFTIRAVINAIIVYTIVSTKNCMLLTTNVTTRKIAKKVAATSHGQQSIF